MCLVDVKSEYDYGIVTSTDILLDVLKELLINNDEFCLKPAGISILT